MSRFASDWSKAVHLSSPNEFNRFYSAEVEKLLSVGRGWRWERGIKDFCKEVQASGAAVCLWTRILHCVGQSGTCPTAPESIQRPAVDQFQRAAEELKKQHERFRHARDILVRACRARSLATGVAIPVPPDLQLDQGPEAAVVMERVRAMQTYHRTEAYDHSGLKPVWAEEVLTGDDIDLRGSWVVKTFRAPSFSPRTCTSCAQVGRAWCVGMTASFPATAACLSCVGATSSCFPPKKQPQ
jgi:hypothetical protein